MAVYTELNEQAIHAILSAYEIGSLKKFAPVSSGIENTNYFLWTSASGSDLAWSEWVLTIFENLEEKSMPFFNQLTGYLHSHGFLVPAPVIDIQGRDVFHVSSNISPKFGVIVPRFKGEAVLFPDISECAVIAKYTARMHLVLEGFPIERPVEHTLEWCRDMVVLLKPSLASEDQSLLACALERYLDYEQKIAACSSGIVHGDLFRDNVLFEKKEISGVIDFYHAGKSAFLFDLAVIANDWAVNFDTLPSLFSEHSDADNSLDFYDQKQLDLIYDEQKLNVLIHAYDSVKPLSEAEKKAWPRFLELAAFRFWLSRLKTKYLEGYQQESKTGDVVKSPAAMKLILLAAMNKS